MARPAKFSRPRLKGVQPRERLFARLDAAVDQAAATWIWGPPGAGKTTLAGSYVAARDVPTLWYHVDRGDADPATLFCELAAAAAQSGLYRGAHLPLLTPECLADFDGFARRWFAALYDGLPRPCAVVFDNVHDAAGTPVLDALWREAVEQVPPGVQVILASRTEPPPSLARARASRALAVIGWPELRFSADEARAVAAASGDGAAFDMRALLERCDGWAAGLILLLQQAPADGGTAGAAPTQQVLFDYFATELFDRLPAPTRHLLLRTALLPWITEPMARALAGNDDAMALLDALHRGHLFVERKADRPPSYQVHALLREFLLDTMQRTLPEPQRRQLELLSAQQLLQAGEHAAALQLYLQAGAAEPALGLVLAQASALLEQGRLQTLSAWAQAVQALLPQPMPWLGYWLGMCEFLSRPAAARARWEAAFAGFEAAGDTVGAAMAAAGVIDSHVIEYRWFAPVDPWASRLARLLDAIPAFPHATAEVMVLTSLISALVIRRPQQRLSLPYAARARELLPLVPSVNVRVMCAARLLHHDVFMGEHGESARLIEETRALLADPRLPPLTACNWANFESLYFQLGDYDERRAIDAMQASIDVASHHGLRFLAVLLRSRMAMLLLEAGDTAGARSQLAQARPASEDETFDAEWWRANSAWIAMLDGDAPAAVHAMRRLVAFNVSMGITTSYGMALMFLANALLAAGDLNGAQAALDDYRAPGVPRTPMGEYTALLLDADIALHRGDSDAAERALRAGFAQARERRLLNTLQWLPAQMSRLCAFALEREIERSFVLELIAVRRVPPPAAGVAGAEAWPWPLKIRCLGRFEIVRDGETVHFEGKAQRKPLALLQALVALGGDRVPIDVLIDALWGDSLDGDEHKTFDVTLHRLRRLLGNERAIHVGDRKVSLDAQQVWVDLRALEQLLQRLPSDDRAQQLDAAPLEHAAPRVLALYGGPLLADEPAAPWLEVARHRLSSRFVRFAMALGAHRERSGQWHEAGRLYERCIQIGAGTETIQRRRMVCLREQGQHDEAIATFLRWRQELKSTQARAPSAETMAVYRTLLTGDEPAPDNGGIQPAKK
ncbi:MAG: BTAD domain-containing putative transcriptional regulator [Burkholderiaceae bacterium]